MKIQDESRDKKYFTIIPNFILNHSNAIDQALYVQMKRIAGDNGICKTGYRYFIKQLGIGFNAYQKSLKYLIKHKWITFVGNEQVDRERGKKEVNTYKVNDIWLMNNKYYCGAENNRSQSHCGAENNLTAVLKTSHCGAETEHKKNIKKEPIKKELSNETDIQKIVNHFFQLKGWNDKSKDWYKKQKIIYSRFVKSAKQILELTEGDVEEAKRKLTIIKNWANSQEIDWGIETIFKRWFDLNHLPQEKIKKPFIENRPAYQKNGQWYIILANGEHKQYIGNNKNVKYK